MVQGSMSRMLRRRKDIGNIQFVKDKYLINEKYEIEIRCGICNELKEDCKCTRIK